MDAERIRDAVERVQCALDLKRRIVGVRFLFDRDEYDAADARPAAAKMPYCVMVKRATRGHSLKADAEAFGCPGAARALGIDEPGEFFTSGRHYRRLGLYKDLAVAKNMRSNMVICGHRAHGVLVKPVEEHATAPDVVLMVVNPFQAMRLVQGYTYQYGYHTAYQVAGNQAVCSECTAYPLEKGAINVSMLCAGTRHMAGWGDDEMGIGLPFNRFLDMVDGLYATVNATEPDRKKRRIQARLDGCGRTDLAVEYGRNYYSGLYVSAKDGSAR